MMLYLYFITSNKSKYLEAKSLGKNFGLNIIQKNIKIAEIKSLDQDQVIRELAKNAYIKVKKPLIIDDTALYFHEYYNFPGTYTKFLFKTIGFSGIKKLVKDHSGAFWRCSVAYINKNELIIFDGELEGKLHFPRGGTLIATNTDWPYNDIFFPKGLSIPLSKLSTEGRLKISHRAIAMKKLFKYLKNKHK